MGSVHQGGGTRVNDDAEIVSEFLVESHENLDQLDRDLVELEQHPGSRELLSSVFRTIHTIKGTSGFLAFNRLEELTHAGENLLSRLRDGELELTEALTGVLLEMVDAVRALLALIEQSGSDAGHGVDIDPVVARLRTALEDPGEPPLVEERAPASVSKPTADGFETASPVPHEASSTNGADASARLLDLPLEPSRLTPERRGTSVRVDIDLLDSLVQQVGELVLTRNQILQKSDGVEDVELLRAAQRLDLVASELQESVMKTRMQPIGQVWAKMPRIVRDLAHQLGREVDLQMDGHETELDRSLLEALKGPLTHLVRNAMDHGIERPDERVAQGKPAKGVLSLRAFHESGQVVIEISDDGAGIDPARIGDVAVQRGLVSRDQLSRMDAREVIALIFQPGFSTASEVTNVSGRGVGMDVVRTNIERIGGTVDMSSQSGRGTTCRVRIPLTLAIIPALVVEEGGDRYAIPQANLVELVRLEGEELRRSVEVLAGAPVLRLRGHLLPLVSLAEVLGEDRADTEALTVVVVASDDLRFGLCVAQVHDTQEIVVKPIGRQLKGMATYAGATIMGDGRVSLILDVGGIAQTAAVESVVQQAVDTRRASGDETALLVLEVSGGRRAALPLHEVARLEEFSDDIVERTGSVEVVQYRDGILPLVRLAEAIGLPAPERTEDASLSVVVHEDDGRMVGIVIDRVLDVVETELALSEVGRRQGVLGSAVVQDRVTDLVDLDAVVRLAGAAV